MWFGRFLDILFIWVSCDWLRLHQLNSVFRKQKTSPYIYPRNDLATTHKRQASNDAHLWPRLIILPSWYKSSHTRLHAQQFLDSVPLCCSLNSSLLCYGGGPPTAALLKLPCQSNHLSHRRSSKMKHSGSVLPSPVSMRCVTSVIPTPCCRCLLVLRL